MTRVDVNFDKNAKRFTAQWQRPLVGELPPRVQILGAALYSGFIYSRIFRRYALSGRRRARRQRSACGDFENFKICWLSPSKVLIGVGWVCVRVECLRTRIVVNDRRKLPAHSIRRFWHSFLHEISNEIQLYIYNCSWNFQWNITFLSMIDTCHIPTTAPIFF